MAVTQETWESDVQTQSSSPSPASLSWHMDIPLSETARLSDAPLETSRSRGAIGTCTCRSVLAVWMFPEEHQTIKLSKSRVRSRVCAQFRWRPLAKMIYAGMLLVVHFCCTHEAKGCLIAPSWEFMEPLYTLHWLCLVCILNPTSCGRVWVAQIDGKDQISKTEMAVSC